MTEDFEFLALQKLDELIISLDNICVSIDEQPVSETLVGEGWTPRDEFAARAMQGLVAGAKHDEAINLHGAAEWSYNMADAMLKARGG